MAAQRVAPQRTTSDAAPARLGKADGAAERDGDGPATTWAMRERRRKAPQMGNCEHWRERERE
jgi:hypothetical protein